MRAESEPQEINTGDVEIKFKGQVYNLDLLLLRMSVEEATRQSPPKREGDTLTPTADFLVSLAHQLSQDHGIVNLTPTGAYEIWVKINEAFIGLKKSTG